MATTTTGLHLVAPHVINVHTSGGSDVPLILVVAVVTPLVTGLFLWWNTGRTIIAESKKQRVALSEERRRLDEMLTAEDKRLHDTLAAEDKRLQDRLAFEREEKDLVEVRSILDSMADTIYQLLQRAERTHEEGRAQLSLARARRSRLESAVSPSAPEFWKLPNDPEGAKPQAKLCEELRSDSERLRLRLGETANELNQLASSIESQSDDLRFLFATLDENLVQRLSDRQASIRTDREAFIRTALAFTAARLPPPPSGAPPTSEEGAAGP